MTQDRVLRVLTRTKNEGKPILPFRELVSKVNDGLPDKDRIKSKEVREAIGALRHQGKIDRQVYSNREFFFVVEKDKK
jgi:hypothetical protein